MLNKLDDFNVVVLKLSFTLLNYTNIEQDCFSIKKE